jgi:signal transduction histidine kinase
LAPRAVTERIDDHPAKLVPFERGASVPWTVFESGDPVLADDIRDHPDVENPETGIRSEMILPLGDHGVFIASSLDVGAFDEVDESLAKVLASNVEAALDRAARETLLRERERSLEALHGAAGELMAAESAEGAARVIAETAREVLDMPLAGVWLYDAVADALVPAAYPDDDRLPDEPPTFRPGESLAWEAFDAGVTSSYDEDELESGAHNPDTAIRSEIVVPLGDHGVLVSGSTRSRAFGDSERHLVDLLATAARAALDRIEREEERAAQRRELERQNERLDEFASVVSHDLRNPLNVALGNLQLLEEEVDSGRVGTIRDALGRMDELLEDVLTMSRQGQAVMGAGPVELRTVARAAWEAAGSSEGTLRVQGGAGKRR